MTTRHTVVLLQLAVLVGMILGPERPEGPQDAAHKYCVS
jgi:hypothetical protein